MAGKDVAIDYFKAMDNDLDRRTRLFDEAVNLAEKAEVVVLAVGEEAPDFGEQAGELAAVLRSTGRAERAH